MKKFDWLFMSAAIIIFSAWTVFSGDGIFPKTGRNALMHKWYQNDEYGDAYWTFMEDGTLIVDYCFYEDGHNSTVEERWTLDEGYLYLSDMNYFNTEKMKYEISSGGRKLIIRGIGERNGGAEIVLTRVR